MFQLHFGLRERQVDGKPEEDDSAQQGETRLSTLRRKFDSDEAVLTVDAS